MVSVAEKTRSLYERDELPEDLRWINDLSPRDQRVFYGEVQVEWSRYCLTEDPSGLIQFFEDWQATAESSRNPDHVADLLAKHEDDDYEEWQSNPKA